MTPEQIPLWQKDLLKEWHIVNWTSAFKVKPEKSTLWMAQNPSSQISGITWEKPSGNQPESQPNWSVLKIKV